MGPGLFESQRDAPMVRKVVRHRDDCNLWAQQKALQNGP